MNRRQFLSGIVTMPIGMAGCLGTVDDPDTPDGLIFETQHRVGSHLVDDDLGPSGERPRSYQTIITNRSTAQERMRDEDEITEFIQETDFDQSYLVVVIAGAWQSGYWLELREIERTEHGIRVSVVTDSPDEPVGDDAAVHSLVIRVTDEESGEPDEVAVEINGESMGTAERN
jgi:hypothetical protein